MSLAVLFCDAAPEAWQASPIAGGYMIADAIARWNQDDPEGCRELLIALTRDGAQSSREQLQAWHLLRQFGLVGRSTDQAPLGVAVEVRLDNGGYEAVFAYRDGDLYYRNVIGIVLGLQDDIPELSAAIADLFSEADELATNVVEWAHKPDQPPAVRSARINVLAPRGRGWVQGTWKTLSQRPTTSRTMSLATNLMLALVDLHFKKRGDVRIFENL